MKNKDYLAGREVELFIRNAIRGFIYIGDSKYFSPVLVQLSRKVLEVARFLDDHRSVLVLFDGEPVCVADLCDEGVNVFPGRPMTRGRMERLIRMTERKYDELRQSGVDVERDARVKAALLSMRDSIDALIGYLDVKSRRGEL